MYKPNREIGGRAFTQEDAGGQQAHVGGAELQVAAGGGQQEGHAQDLHRVAGVGPAAHQQQQPVKHTETCGGKRRRG